VQVIDQIEFDTDEIDELNIYDMGDDEVDDELVLLVLIGAEIDKLVLIDEFQHDYDEQLSINEIILEFQLIVDDELEKVTINLLDEHDEMFIQEIDEMVELVIEVDEVEELDEVMVYIDEI